MLVFQQKTGSGCTSFALPGHVKWCGRSGPVRSGPVRSSPWALRLTLSRRRSRKQISTSHVERQITSDLLPYLPPSSTILQSPAYKRSQRMRSISSSGCGLNETLISQVALAPLGKPERRRYIPERALLQLLIDVNTVWFCCAQEQYFARLSR